MDLNKLSKIQDSFIEDTREQDYRDAAKVLNTNFYAKLLSKIETFVRRSDKAKDTPKQVITDILGNDVILEYDPSSKKFEVFVNGVKTYSGEYGKSNTIDSVVSTVKAEISNRVDIVRPDGSNIWKERQQFSEKNLDKLNLKLPKAVYKAMEGKGETSIVKNNRKSKKVLTKDEYDYLVKQGQINPDDYNRWNENHYVKAGSPIYVVKREYNDLLNNIDELYAREPEFEEFSEANKLGEAYVLYGNDLFVLRNEELKKLK